MIFLGRIFIFLFPGSSLPFPCSFQIEYYRSAFPEGIPLGSQRTWNIDKNPGFSRIA